MSASTCSKEPPTGLGKLIQVVQKRYPGLTVKESIKAIVMIKEKNRGALKGLKFIKFHKLLKMVVSEKVQVDKQNYKEGRKSCSVCFRKFSKRQAVERHMVVHEKYENTVMEEELPQGYKDLPDFDETIENYDENKAQAKQSPEFKCTVCKKEYRHEASLNRHTKKVHTDGSETFPCDLCDLKFTRKDNLYVHKRKVHNAYHLNLDAIRNSQISRLSCEMCSQNFESIKQFEAHIALKVCQDKLNMFDIDDGEKYQCDLCTRSYAHKKNLLAHLNWKHRSKETFKCEICDATYLHKRTLARHSKKLHGND